MNEDDQLRREVIGRVVCDNALNMDAMEARYDIVFDDSFAPEMEPLQSMSGDGPLRVQNRRLEVLAAGRLLSCDIAMVFDRYRRESPAGIFRD